MKALILVVALVAVIAAPIMSFACPPPPAPGYDGSGAGDGPAPSGDGSGGTETGGRRLGQRVDSHGRRDWQSRIGTKTFYRSGPLPTDPVALKKVPRGAQHIMETPF